MSRTRPETFRLRVTFSSAASVPLTATVLASTPLDAFTNLTRFSGGSLSLLAVAPAELLSRQPIERIALPRMRAHIRVKRRDRIYIDEARFGAASHCIGAHSHVQDSKLIAIMPLP